MNTICLDQYLKETVFAICFNTASFDASANEEPTFHCARTRRLFGLPCLVQVWMWLRTVIITHNNIYLSSREIIHRSIFHEIAITILEQN